MDEVQNTLILTGHVVETLLRDGKQVAKISLRSCHIFVPMDAIPDAHLGDIVTINADISIHKVEPYVDTSMDDRHIG